MEFTKKFNPVRLAHQPTYCCKFCIPFDTPGVDKLDIKMKFFKVQCSN